MNTTPFARPLWDACFSSLHLDRFLLGELDDASAGEVRAHLPTCARCSEAIDWLSPREPLPALKVVPLQPRRSRWSRAVAIGGAAAAAAVLLVLPPSPPAERSKGSGFALGMYVQHGTDVRRAGDGDAIDAGDAIRFSVTAPAPGFVAVLSSDPRGRGSIYYPQGTRAAPVQAGADVPLPLATRLDETRGEEHVVGLFCTSAIELEPVRASLERGNLAVPEGCQVIRWRFVKR